MMADFRLRNCNRCDSIRKVACSETWGAKATKWAKCGPHAFWAKRFFQLDLDCKNQAKCTLETSYPTEFWAKKHKLCHAEGFYGTPPLIELCARLLALAMLLVSWHLGSIHSNRLHNGGPSKNRVTCASLTNYAYLRLSDLLGTLLQCMCLGLTILNSLAMFHRRSHFSTKWR